jgi:hypothetical protein
MAEPIVEEVTFMKALLATVATLTAVVGILWRQSISTQGDMKKELNELMDRLSKELDECKKDRAELWKHFLRDSEHTPRPPQA